MREDRHKIVHVAQFCVFEVSEQSKLINDDKSKTNSGLWREYIRELTRMKLYIYNMDVDYLSIYIYQNSSNLRLMHFTLYKLYQQILREM